MKDLKEKLRKNPMPTKRSHSPAWQNANQLFDLALPDIYL